MTYKIQGMDCRDIAQLNGIFRKMHSKVEITGNEYLRRIGSFTNQMNEPIHFKPNRQWNIEIKIRGYMVSYYGFETPLWEIYIGQIV